jgi:hypothetical protein
MIYDKLAPEEVNTVHHLFKFLRKLRVIGLIDTKVNGVPPSMTGVYALSIIKIHHGVFISADDLMESLFSLMI